MKSHGMFPHSSEGQRGHLPIYNGSFTRPPFSFASSSRFYFNRDTQQTHINNYSGPENLPVYQWKPTLIPLQPTTPPVANSRKRQYSTHSQQQLAKRQRVENFDLDEIFPSFELPPPPTQLLVSGTSPSSPIVCNFQSPPPHSLGYVPCTPETPTSLQSYAKDKVSAQMVELFESCQQQQSDLYRKETYRAQLQKDIRRLYPGARLYLTGSSMSGLGCRSSDADLCLIVNVKKKYEIVINTLSTLLRLFKTLPYVDRPVLIRAKVPILRFKEKSSNVEFDLNVNNTVGIRNTFLLRSYTHADNRIRPLMLVIKKWAGHCEINDASKGTLSSYTLALMALNYLQSVQPPVIPSLQRDHPAYFDPSLDLDMVPDASQRVPRYISKNRSSLGELFLGFLEYYSSKFRWDRQIISVREARALPKIDSTEWRSKFICVEEPFERHNVARAVYEKEKFDTIKAKFTESCQILKEKKDLKSLLPLEAIIHKEQTGR